MTDLATQKDRLLSLAASAAVAPLGIYPMAAAELIAAGLLQSREVFSKVGARNIRLFATMNSIVTHGRQP